MPLRICASASPWIGSLNRQCMIGLSDTSHFLNHFLYELKVFDNIDIITTKPPYMCSFHNYFRSYRYYIWKLVKKNSLQRHQTLILYKVGWLLQRLCYLHQKFLLLSDAVVFFYFFSFICSKTVACMDMLIQE